MRELEDSLIIRYSKSYLYIKKFIYYYQGLNMKKTAIFVICAALAIIGGYFGYEKYQGYKLIESLKPSVKCISASYQRIALRDRKQQNYL